MVAEAMACERTTPVTDTRVVPCPVEQAETVLVVRRLGNARLAERPLTLITNRDLCPRMGVTA